MFLRPFLTQFAVKRYDVPDVNQIRLMYNQEMDYNEFTCGDGLTEYQELSTKTYTNIKTERPEKTISNHSYLTAKTLTEVKSEAPDIIPESLLYMSLATRTFTDVQQESIDSDR